MVTSTCIRKLTTEHLKGIFLGKIKNFSELVCADQKLTVVCRSDGTGTTYNFTKHLSAISDEWKNGPDLIGGNPNPPAGYPIVTFTWVLAYETGDSDKTAALKKTFEFMLSEKKAQSQALELGYVSLPKRVVEKSLAAVEKISE